MGGEFLKVLGTMLLFMLMVATLLAMGVGVIGFVMDVMSLYDSLG